MLLTQCRLLLNERLRNDVSDHLRRFSSPPAFCERVDRLGAYGPPRRGDAGGGQATSLLGVSQRPRDDRRHAAVHWREPADPTRTQRVADLHPQWAGSRGSRGVAVQTVRTEPGWFTGELLISYENLK